MEQAKPDFGDLIFNSNGTKQPPKISNLYNLGQTIEEKFDFN